MPGQKRKKYDIALSFAGEDRKHAERLAAILSRNKVAVFYDNSFKADLWGKDLYQHLQAIYKEQSRYCVVFVSKSYLKKAWTKHELKQVQARAFGQDREYILPLRVDDAVLPGLNRTVGYIDLRTHSLDQVASLLLAKLGKTSLDSATVRRQWKGDFVRYNGRKVSSFWPEQVEQAQRNEFALVTRAFARIRHGEEKYWGRKKLRAQHVCHDCAALPGQFHVSGCDMEECPLCNGQAIACGCAHEPATRDQLTGEWEVDGDDRG
ncbi:toll/interleukin-1 receptor domain-containing protein [Bradyrhizobium guangdongense]